MDAESRRTFALIKTLRKSPEVLSGILLNVLRNWFSQGGKFGYSTDKVTTKIVIEPSYLWDPSDCQNRPGLYIKRGGYMPKGMGRAGMDDMLKRGSNAKNQYAVLPVCSMAVFCISKTPGELEDLAWKTGQVLICMAPIIKADFNFLDFSVEQIGEIGKTEEFKEFWTVTISIVTKFSEQWEVKEFAPLVKKILVKSYSELVGNITGEYGSGGYGNDAYNE